MSERAGASPVIVGGLGGSGTRVVAELLMAMGVDMGRDQNIPKDNLLFTLLFKRPYWYREAVCRNGEIRAVIELHDRLMAGFRPRASDWRVLLAAAIDSVRYDHIGLRKNHHLPQFIRRIVWTLARIRKVYAASPAHSQAWGWKEPNTHIYLEQLSRYYPTMRYIHVIRHGLDMAFSKNQGQLFNWASLFDPVLDKITDTSTTPQDALQFWVIANERAISLARNLLGSRFLLVNYDDLCTQPAATITALHDFLGKDYDEDKLVRMTSIPHILPSMGRYRNEDLSIFDKKLIDGVRQMGFTVEGG